MADRSLLGAADVSDDQLAAMAAELLHLDEAELVDSRAETVDYDLPAITTGGRWWVTGHVTTGGGRLPFRMFVKQVQSWSRSPFFQLVPPEYRELASSSVPWKTEAEVYRSGLTGLLPDGLAAPRALGVFDLDEESCSVWLEEVLTQPVTWDVARYERAAHLLGRFAGSPRLAALGELRHVDWTMTTYAIGRLRVQVVPMLMGEEVWQHPLCAPFADLKERLRAAAATVLELAAEADTLPRVLSHGDACPNNLLAGPAGELVMIDFGFLGGAPVGFDLCQLLVGDVQIGRRRADEPAGLAELDEAILTAYVAGLRAEGCEVPEEQVRRGHALCLLVMTGLSSLPFDLFDQPVDDHTMQVAAERATLARYALDLVESTVGQLEGH